MCAKTKMQISCAIPAQLISADVFSTQDNLSSCFIRNFKLLVFCAYTGPFGLFELMLYIQVYSCGHVGMLPPYNGTFTHDTQNALYKNNHTTKPIRLICTDGFTKPHFLGRHSHEWLTSNQMVGQ